MDIRLARSANDLQHVLDTCRVGFDVRAVPASATDEWSMIDGALQHRSRGFFSVAGVQPVRGGEGCVLLYQPQGAVTGLLSARIDGEICFLLQGRAEPGCLGEAQFGPTVQSTPANFLRLHGGASTPYVETFIEQSPGIALLDDTTQLDLGERYLFKTKRSILAELSAPAPVRPGFVWATGGAIREATLKSAFLNIDLRSILSIARWSSDENDGLAPRSAEVRRNLGAPVRFDILGAVLGCLQSAPSQARRFVSLESLENWRQTELGWSEREPRQGFAIEFFTVSAPLREKPDWTQPLVNSATTGQVVLACREREGFLEFLVCVTSETGLATGAAVAPSYVRYPGAHKAPPYWLDGQRHWSATADSDEGGRFYRDASQYQIVRIDDGAGEIVNDGLWLRLPELKALLRMSNVCTIQLRGVVSQLLGAP